MIKEVLIENFIELEHFCKANTQEIIDALKYVPNSIFYQKMMEDECLKIDCKNFPSVVFSIKNIEKNVVSILFIGTLGLTK